jgi:hypothetical protein
MVEEVWNRKLFDKVGDKIIAGLTQGLIYVESESVDELVRFSLTTAMPALRYSDIANGRSVEEAIYDVGAVLMNGAGVCIGDMLSSVDRFRMSVAGFMVTAVYGNENYEQDIIDLRNNNLDPKFVGSYVRTGLMRLVEKYDGKWYEIGARAASIDDIATEKYVTGQYAVNKSLTAVEEGPLSRSTPEERERAFKLVVTYVAKMRDVSVAWTHVRRMKPGSLTVGTKDSDVFTTAPINARSKFVISPTKVYYTNVPEVRPGVFDGYAQILESVIQLEDGVDVDVPDDGVAAWVYSASNVGNDLDAIVRGYRARGTQYILTAPQHCYALTHGPLDVTVQNGIMTTRVATKGGSFVYYDTVRSDYSGLGEVLPLGRLAVLGYGALSDFIPANVSCMSPLLLGWVAVFNLPSFMKDYEKRSQTVITTTAPYTRLFGKALAAVVKAPPVELRYKVRTVECVSRGMEPALDATYDAIGEQGFQVSVSGHVIAQMVLVEVLGVPITLFVNTKLTNLQGRIVPRLGAEFPSMTEVGNVGTDDHWHSVVDDVMAVSVAARLVGVRITHYQIYLDHLLDLAVRFPRYRLESDLVARERVARSASIEWVRTLVGRR